MSEEPHTYQAQGDEALEARIVAWVLDEASPFEADELKRLCIERPELEIFRRRIHTIHHLLDESENQKSDPAWQLDPTKRADLDATFGKSSTAPANVIVPKKRRARMWMSAAASIAILIALSGLFAPMVMQQRKSASGMPMLAPLSADMAAYETTYPAELVEGTPATITPQSLMPGSQARTRASSAASPTPIPVPEMDIPQPSVAFGDTSDFGSGWGEGELAQNAVPTLGDTPMTGRLFAGKEASRRPPAPSAAPESYAFSIPSTESTRSLSGPVGGFAALEEAAAIENPLAQHLQPNAGGYRYSPGATDGSLGIERADDIELSLSADYSSDYAIPAPAPAPASNDDIRAGLLAEVDRAWELAVPQDAAAGEPIPAPSEDPVARGPENRSLAQREMRRRQESVGEADALLLQGREAYAADDYQKAHELYKEAAGKLPDAPLMEDRRAAIDDHLADAAVARAAEFRRVGKYNEAREILEPHSLTDQNARRELAFLDDPLRTNPALTYEHVQEVDKVRRNLYMAEGNYNLGKFDDARKAYEDVLRVDPHNTAARRGMERIAARKSDYYRAAYDHTRSELLMEVDQAWELALPVEDADAAAPSDKSDLSPEDVQALRDLQETLQESRAELSKIVRTKGITYTGEDSRDQAIQRGIDAQDYIEAKATYERDLRRLQEMRARLLPAPEKPQAPPPPAPENETSAAADPFSTFSLNVSDAAFVIARDAIRRGERPAPEQVRVEQFYNALDYGDPAPAAGEAVATQIEQAAHPVLPGRNLVRIAARVGSTGRAATQPLHLTLLVDQSGSMVRADRQAILEKTLATLATLLGENDVVHVIGFARQPRLIAEALPGNRANEIRALVHQAAAEGGTNMEAALELAHQIAARHQKPGAQNRVVVLSDGAANLGDADPTRLAERITQMRQQGIATDIAGIGSDGLNDALLAELARHGDGRYHIVTRETGDRLARDLAGAFRPAASDVKVQVVFNPERVGGWKLIGFEQHRLNTEDFRNDAVDAAELAAEEAGVAIYQVETLPQGRGEIGEVFIRFRDAATGRIVERSWPLPYDANTPALDQARPSMQLATLAMLTAEKLRGGPLGESIDLTTHRPLIQSLTDHYRHDPRAHELFEMITQLTNR